MEEDKKKKIIQILITTILLVVAFVIEKVLNPSIIIKFILYLIPYLIISYDIYLESFESIKEGDIFDECFLMCIASIGAFVISFFSPSTEFLEATLIMLFFQVGEYFEDTALDDSEKAINEVLNIRPDYANLLDEKGKMKKVEPKILRLFDTIVINPHEKVPVDGEVIEGNSNLNTSALTGESMLKSVNVGDYIMSGCINLNGQLKVKVLKTFEESTASKIIDLVENGIENKAKSDKFITRFARIYTPLVLLFAMFVMLIPPIFDHEYLMWINRSLNFLVVSCPCALVISVPLSYFGGIGRASKMGVLIKGAVYLEDLSKVSTVAFDKTGTLTKGSFEVIAIHPNDYNEKELLHLAAHVESATTHPIGKSLKEAYDSYNNLDDDCVIRNIEEIGGLGIKAEVNNDLVYVGSEKLMNKISITPVRCDKSGSIIHIATKNKYLGHIIISDKIREDVFDTIQRLKEKNIKVVMLSGDNKESNDYVAKQLEIDDYYYDLMPKDKVKIINKLIKNTSRGKKVLFIGDGINDAPVLARSDLGVSMGGLGSDAAIDASNIVLMDDKVSKINDVIDISIKTQKIVIQNIIFTLIVKFVTLILSFLGYAPIALAVFADVGVTILAILNALRILKIK
ncbi:MAG: cadmium-translocating P-type ATPase [Bacilli bacterium]|nr:cadmium-translocating P-type ATPase [Bacilli bacterium]